MINTHAVEDPSFIGKAALLFGSQSVVVSIGVKKNLWGKYEVYTCGGRKSTGLDPVAFAVDMEKMGAGELIINSIDRDGTMTSYDFELIKRITGVVGIPVVA